MFRFFTHFLHSEGLVPVKEPFSSLITQGMVKSRSYRLKSSTKYLREDDVYQKGEKYFQKETDLPVVSQWEKMSKSKHNGVDPGLMVAEYGCDTVRLMMLSSVGPGSERKWSEAESYPGVKELISLFDIDELLPGAKHDYQAVEAGVPGGESSNQATT